MTSPSPRLAALALALALAPSGCSREEASTTPAPPTTPAPAPAVRVAPVRRQTLTELVSGPGKTAALVQQKVRAPFAGTLVALRVADGDPVRRGEAIGAIVSRDSEAALSGAREMLREARTPAERTDADRAVALAEKSLVRATLTSAVEGRVLSHSASAGDRVSEDQEIVTVEDGSSIVFLADLPQVDLARVRPRESATVALAGNPTRIAGTVRSILPAANPTDFTAPVRIDLGTGGGRLPLGVFGTAQIAVGRRENVRVVPEGALLRDDVNGTTRVAVVRNGRVHWVAVGVGLRQQGAAELSSGEVADGEPVVVSGQVGLPEGAAVTPQP